MAAALTSVSVLTATAQLNGDGFYRAKNVKTERYMTVKDNHGKIDYHSTTVDAGALETSRIWANISCDPGSVMYIQKQSNGEYNIMAQGTSVYDMIGYYIHLTNGATANSYQAWQTAHGMTVYLTDARSSNDEEYVYDSGKYTKDWYIIPVSSSSDNYLGIKPTVTVGDKHYSAYYNGFTFKPVSKGMKVMYITGVDEVNGYAIYKEVTGEVPAKSPVIVECSSTEPTDNRIDLFMDNTAALSNNKLKGNYFNVWNDMSGHRNRTAYDPTTMRVIGVCANGKPGMVKSSTLDYLQANSSYLTVSANCKADLELISEEDYAAGINDVTVDSSKEPANVYNLMGVKVRSKVTSIEDLPQGVYIFKGKKVTVK